MEYQKVTNLLDDITNKPSKFRTRSWVEINDESLGNYKNNNIKFKMSVIRSNLCDYSDAYIHVKANTAVAAAPVSNANKKVVFKNYTSFNNCISEINKTQNRQCSRC